jgi:hypothetical protein
VHFRTIGGLQSWRLEEDMSSTDINGEESVPSGEKSKTDGGDESTGATDTESLSLLDTPSDQGEGAQRTEGTEENNLEMEAGDGEVLEEEEAVDDPEEDATGEASQEETEAVDGDALRDKTNAPEVIEKIFRFPQGTVKRIMKLDPEVTSRLLNRTISSCRSTW